MPLFRPIQRADSSDEETRRKQDFSRKVLCIAHMFPPVAETGSHRTRAVVRHLPSLGWKPIVVTAKPHPSFRLDDALMSGLPDGLSVYRTIAPDILPIASQAWSRIRRLARPWQLAKSTPAQSMKPAHQSGGADTTGGWIDWLSWWLQVPDLALGWLPFGMLAARTATIRHDCQAIYTSAPPFTTHLIGLMTKRITGLPWIADFRDPWRGNPFRRTIPYRSIDRYDAWLERVVIQDADRIICNCEPVREEYQSRFPTLVERFITIPNGFEPEEFHELGPKRPLGAESILLTHAGVFYGPRRPHSLFQALRILSDNHESDVAVHLQLVGSPTFEGEHLSAIASRYGVGHRVLLPGEVSHRHALELLAGSDIQVLVGFDGPGANLQVPGKLFEYLGVGRPILALATPQSAIARTMVSSGGYGTVCSPDSPEEIAAAILRMTSARGQFYEASGNCNGNLVQFTRREQVRQIASLLDALVSPRAKNGASNNPPSRAANLDHELAACP